MFNDLKELIDKGDYMAIRDWYVNKPIEDRLLFILEAPNEMVDNVVTAIDIAGYIKGREDESFVAGYRQGVKESIETVKRLFNEKS